MVAWILNTDIIAGDTKLRSQQYDIGHLSKVTLSIGGRKSGKNRWKKKNGKEKKKKKKKKKEKKKKERMSKEENREMIIKEIKTGKKRIS